MRAEIVSIGTELLLGTINDTNAQYLAQRLAGLGIDCYYVSQVGDNLERITEVLRRAWDRSDLTITTGGLGPTADDLTRESIAASAKVIMPPWLSPSAPMRAALMKQFVAWVTKGTPMPPSRYPTIADGTLVKDSVAAMGFPGIPGRPSPENLAHPLLDYDLGPHLNYQDASGFLTAAPKLKRSLPQLVVKVDADGNEVAGIKSPLQMAPLGTYVGWNVTASGPLKGHVCGNSGGWIPFAKTKAERLASGDPRPSLEERYRSHDEYVQAVSKAASKLVQERYLQQQDADAMIKQADASDIRR